MFGIKPLSSKSIVEAAYQIRKSKAGGPPMHINIDHTTTTGRNLIAFTCTHVSLARVVSAEQYMRLMTVMHF